MLLRWKAAGREKAVRSTEDGPQSETETHYNAKRIQRI